MIVVYYRGLAWDVRRHIDADGRVVECTSPKATHLWVEDAFTRERGPDVPVAEIRGQMAMRKGVRRFLVTGDEGVKWNFWTGVVGIASACQCSGRTTMYLVDRGNAGRFIRMAGRDGITLQELFGVGEDERVEFVSGDPDDRYVTTRKEAT